MRAVTVDLGGPVVLRVPVPSKILAALESLKGDDLAALERAYVGVLASSAVDGWRWPLDPEQAWAAMWDDGVSWAAVQAAVAAWVAACNGALGVLLEAATEQAATFPSGPAGDGDRQP